MFISKFIPLFKPLVLKRKFDSNIQRKKEIKESVRSARPYLRLNFIIEKLLVEPGQGEGATSLYRSRE